MILLVLDERDVGSRFQACKELRTFGRLPDHVFGFVVRKLKSTAARDDDKTDYYCSNENVIVDDSSSLGRERAIVNLRVIPRCVPA